MKLGILVVYFVRKKDEWMLDLHLEQITKNTSVPYKIYASASRLLPEFRKKLECDPNVIICDCPDTDLRKAKEHSFYLDHLARIAAEDGASHMVTLHVDSFPIRTGWAEEAAGSISDNCVFATLARGKFMGQCTACFFFSRDFYLKYRPAFLLTDEDFLSAQYPHFYKNVLCLPHESGVGFLFKAYLNGLTWHLLQRSNKEEDCTVVGEKHSNFSGIYGDMVFHLEGGARLNESKLGRGRIFVKLKLPVFFFLLISVLRPILPGKFHRYIRRKLVKTPAYTYAKKNLYENPASYIHYLRTGRRI